MPRKNEAYISELTYFGLMKIAAPDLRARLNAMQSMRNQALISHASNIPHLAPSPRSMYPHPPLPDLSRNVNIPGQESGPVMNARQAAEHFAHHGQGSFTERKALNARHVAEQRQRASFQEDMFGQTPEYHDAMKKTYAANDRQGHAWGMKENLHLDEPTTRMGSSEPASYELKNYYR